MSDYKELIDWLRNDGCDDSPNCEHCPDSTRCDLYIMNKAADAIEELSKKRDAACWGCKCSKIERNEWISVTERLPEDGIPVLAYYERNAWPEGCNAPVRKKEIGVGWHVDGMWHVDGCSKVVGIAWMPLPDAPEEEQE